MGLLEATRTLNILGVRKFDATSQSGGQSELWTKLGTWDKIVVAEEVDEKLHLRITVFCVVNYGAVHYLPDRSTI